MERVVVRICQSNQGDMSETAFAVVKALRQAGLTTCTVETIGGGQDYNQEPAISAHRLVDLAEEAATTHADYALCINLLPTMIFDGLFLTTVVLVTGGKPGGGCVFRFAMPNNIVPESVLIVAGEAHRAVKDRLPPKRQAMENAGPELFNQVVQISCQAIMAMSAEIMQGEPRAAQTRN